jgi:glycosyltransferase involved in cell wall biosynthesis
VAIQASVIICVRDGAATIDEQLQALAGQSFDGSWELVVVDNGSTDNTVQIVRRREGRLPGLRVVSAPAKASLAYARNVGAQAANGEVLVFCDADDVADPEWLSALVAGARQADLVGGRLEVERLNGELLRHWRGVSEDHLRRPTALGYMTYAVGANFAVRRAAFHAIGGCDERFVSCGDDLDLSWRLQRQGGSLVLRPDAVMHYRLRQNLGGAMRQRYAYGQAEALLRRKFSDEISPMSPRARLRSVVVALGRSWNLLGGPRRRGAWLTSASHLAGQLRGSIRYRVWA